MGVDLEELRHAVDNNEPAAEVLELTRRQHWCAPEARFLAGRALAAGHLLRALDDDVAEMDKENDDPSLVNATRKRDAALSAFEATAQKAVTVETEVRRPSVAEWHARRRKAILEKHPEIAELFKPSWASFIACVGLVLLQAFVALFLVHSVKTAFFYAATVGATAAFGSQALNHELSHDRRTSLAAPCALLASATTTFPWFSYYFAGGHERHHLHVGTPRDADADALFWLWERQPVHEADIYGIKKPKPSPKWLWLDSVVGGLLWASTVALLLPIAYAYALLRCLVRDWDANWRETLFWLSESFASYLVMRTLVNYSNHGFAVVLYLALSSAFSVGFLCHPCIGFWLMQHACATDLDNESRIKPALSKPLVGRTNTPSLGRLQPTLSYCGSTMWHWLTFQELRHLEHHDFPWVPWVRLPELERIAPEFYSPNHVYHVPSIRRLCGAWLGATDEKFDFACRKRLVGRARARAAASTARYDAPPTSKTGRGGVRYM
jgi:sphingolipid delta-4 desaturase